MQKTFFIIKPDAVKRHLMGQVIDRIERRGFIIVLRKPLAVLVVPKSF